MFPDYYYSKLINKQPMTTGILAGGSPGGWGAKAKSALTSGKDSSLGKPGGKKKSVTTTAKPKKLSTAGGG